MECCPVCGARHLRKNVISPRLLEWRCAACGHHVAEHTGAVTSSADYHEQYEQGAFIDALRATRLRQASVICARVRALAPGARSLLDFGCGRGWFLDEARRVGMSEVAGADISDRALQLLAERNIPGIKLDGDRPEELDIARLPFRPEVLTLLDVIEHFPPARVRDILGALVARLRPELTLVVVKVPVTTGVLFRAAGALSSLGQHGAIEQLYQVGTFPPHRSYFSRRSLEIAMRGAGLEPVAAMRDPDFEPSSLADRARAIAPLPRWSSRWAGAMAAALARLSHAEDSVILACRPAAARG